MIDIFFMIAVGTVLLYYGAEFLIRGVASFSLRFGISTLLVSIVVVGFGTSTPELIVSINAILADKGDVVLGNVIGSNIANIGLVLGMCSFMDTIPIPWKLVRYDAFIMVGVTALFCVFLMFNTFTRLTGILFLLGLIGYIVWAFLYEKKKEKEFEEALSENVPKATKSLFFDIVMMGGGLIALLIGARMFFSGAIAITALFGVSDAVIGLTVVAIGTSLPELAASSIAVIRKHGDIALGNIIGSCIYNILGIIGFTSLIHPFQGIDISWVDYGLMLAYAVVLLLIMSRGTKITRTEGFIFLVVYFGYIYFLAYGDGGEWLKVME